jgi:hypothetical protein
MLKKEREQSEKRKANNNKKETEKRKTNNRKKTGRAGE